MLKLECEEKYPLNIRKEYALWKAQEVIAINDKEEHNSINWLIENASDPWCTFLILSGFDIDTRSMEYSFETNYLLDIKKRKDLVKETMKSLINNNIIHRDEFSIVLECIGYN